ncbi:MAG: Trp family transcriptional regulator [bacterium]|nr:Trp family transcriptional regulator [bacterium]MDA1292863.1 Trp family transcriptional regulator [bacterium]
MGKIDHRHLSRQQYESLGREFSKTCQSASSVKNLTTFIDHLLTPSERVMLSRRMRVGKKLLQKKGQLHIQEELGVGQSTVDTVERLLEKMGPGERKILKG